MAGSRHTNRVTPASPVSSWSDEIEIFWTMQEARVLVEQWRKEYNQFLGRAHAQAV
jgi:hypothetical protein